MEVGRSREEENGTSKSCSKIFFKVSNEDIFPLIHVDKGAQAPLH